MSPAPPAPLSPRSAHLLMHLTVFVWGFTAILGRLITLEAVSLVWYRLLLVVVMMAGLATWRGLPLRVAGPTARLLLSAGALVALHWLLFYGCIKYAGVAVAVLCLSTTPFFTSLLEPLVFRRRPAPLELVLGLLVMVGVSLLVQVEGRTDATGLAMGLGSAFFSAGFGSLNGKLAREVRGEVMTTWEFAAAATVTTGFLLLRPGAFVAPWAVGRADVLWLLVLAVGCTVVPWLWSLRVLRTLTPWALALAVSLEPVYSMLLAWFFFPGEEQLTGRFYAGVGVLLGLVAFNTWLKRPR